MFPTAHPATASANALLASLTGPLWQLLATVTVTAPGTELPEHLPGTLLPRGFFLVVGLMYLGALALDRLAERLRLPAAIAVLLLGLSLRSLHTEFRHVSPPQVATLHLVSLALLLFYAGLKTDLRRIRGLVPFALRLSSLGVLISMALLSVALIGLNSTLGPELGPGVVQSLPVAAALLTAACLTATDASATEDLLHAQTRPLRPQLRHLLVFESALSTLAALLCFGFVVALFQGQSHPGHSDFHAEVTGSMLPELLAIGHHLLAGLGAGLLVGFAAGRLMSRLVRSEEHLLILALSVAFMAFGLGQLLGGGGMMAVFTCGLLLGNRHDRADPSQDNALREVILPFNTAAEFTILMLLGLLVSPRALLAVLPLGIGLALVLLLVVRPLTLLLTGHGSGFSRSELLLISSAGARGGVPLALALALDDELPHLIGIAPAMAGPLASHLLAVVFLVVLVTLILQAVALPVLVRRLAP